MKSVAKLLLRRSTATVRCNLLVMMSIICGLGLTQAFVPGRPLVLVTHNNILSVKTNSKNHRQFGRTNPIYYSNNDTAVAIKLHAPQNRFERTAATMPALDELCILTIDNKRYNLTAWGK